MQSIKLVSQITLLNRPFPGSKVATVIPCQYPIQITKIESSSSLSSHESAIVTVHFQNLSTRPYGMCSESAGSIAFHYSSHSLIHLTLIDKETSVPNFYQLNDSIAPKSTSSIRFKLVLDANAIHHVYEDLSWNIDLLLRDRAIERRECQIRVLPSFLPNLHTDVLLITNSDLNQTEYLAYQQLFNLFKYSSQIRDVDRYRNLDHSRMKCLNTADLIIFICLPPELTFNAIRSRLFVEHMYSSKKVGFICIGGRESKEFDFALFDYNHSQIHDHRWSAFGIRRPDRDELFELGNQIRLDFEKQDDYQHLYQFIYEETNNSSSTRFLWK